jgi:DNA-binding winged helix-turn-helix (wHTH) protein
MSDEIGQRTASDGLRDSPSVAKETPSQETLRLYEFGPFCLDPAERKLLRGNEIVVLTPKAFDTLVLLVRNSGHLLERNELINMLWPDSFVEEGSLSNNIFLLRKALGEDPAYIETVPRRGYRFVGAVRQLPHAAPTHLDKPPAVGTHGIASLPAKARRPWRSRAALGIAAVALLASLASASWFYIRAGRGGETIDSLVVLPFVNANSDPSTEYLSDGLTESLINSLSQLPNLKVMSRDSAFRFKGEETDPQTVGRELNVRAIFKGKVTQRGGHAEHQRRADQCPRWQPHLGTAVRPEARRYGYSPGRDRQGNGKRAAYAFNGRGREELDQELHHESRSLSGLSERPLLVEQEHRGGIQQGHRLLSAGDHRRSLTRWPIPAWPIVTARLQTLALFPRRRVI